MQLSEWMKRENIDDEGFGAKIGRNRVSVSRYRRGKEPPSAETLKRIVEATGGEVSANEVLGIVEIAE